MRCFHSEIFSKLHHLSDKYILNFGTLPLQAIDSTIFLKLNLNILIESNQQKIIKIVLAHVWTEPNKVWLHPLKITMFNLNSEMNYARGDYYLLTYLTLRITWYVEAVYKIGFWFSFCSYCCCCILFGENAFANLIFLLRYLLTINIVGGNILNVSITGK